MFVSIFKTANGTGSLRQFVSKATRLKLPSGLLALGTANGTIKVPAGKGRTVTKKVPPDPQGLSQIARASGGQGYAVQDASHLTSLYKQLGSKLSHKLEKRKISDEFAGGALILVLIGSAMSLRWFGRLI